MYMHTGFHSKLNGNMLPEEVSISQCTPGVGLTPVIIKDAFLLTSNLFVETILMMETYMQEKLAHMNQMNMDLSLIHISEPTRRTPISYAVFCLKKKKTKP